MGSAPLVRVSEVKTSAHGSNTNSAPDAKLLRYIKAESDRLSQFCRRRFDRRVDTVYLNARSTAHGGSVWNRELWLGDDLQSLSAVINGDGSSVAVDTITLLPRQSLVTAYARIRLPQTSYWTSGTNDPEDAIAVTGIWGWGGQWDTTNDTVQSGINAAETSLTVETGSAFEAGMVLKINNEYLYVSAVSSNTLTIERAFNGSTAAAHLAGAPIYEWRAEPIVRELVVRLVQWRVEQDKSPLFGQGTVGDLTFPIDIAGIPNDVQQTIRSAKLKRVTMGMTV